MSADLGSSESDASTIVLSSPAALSLSLRRLRLPSAIFSPSNLRRAQARRRRTAKALC